MINIRFNGFAVKGFEQINVYGQPGYEQYLGAAIVVDELTPAIRQFNLPTSVAPGEWPTTHRTITGRVIRRGK